MAASKRALGKAEGRGLGMVWAAKADYAPVIIPTGGAAYPGRATIVIPTAGTPEALHAPVVIPTGGAAEVEESACK